MPLIDPSAPGAHAVRPRRRKRVIYGPPAPAPSITRTPFERPFTAQRTQARENVRSTRRNLPALTLAAPPRVRAKTGLRTPGADRPLTLGEVQGFLDSTSKITQAARGQIVASIRRQVAGTHGEDRIHALDQVVDEIRHDPRLAPTRQAIRYYTALERSISRPQTPQHAEPRPKTERVRTHLGVGPLEATIPTGQLATLGLKGIRALPELAASAPGLQTGAPGTSLIRAGFRDIGALGTAPFVGGYTVGSAILGDIAGSLNGGELAPRETALLKGAIAGVKQEVSHPVESFKQHPVLSIIDLLGAESLVGRSLGAGARGLGSTVDAPGVRGALARAGQPAQRLPVSLTADLGGGAYARRRGSKDIFRSAAQRAGERRREIIYDAEGNAVAVKPRQGIIRDEGTRLARRQANMLAGRANLTERLLRDIQRVQLAVPGRVLGATRRTAGRLPIVGRRVIQGLPTVRGRAARDVVSMVTEGTILTGKHFEANLRAHVERIKKRLAEHDAQIAKTGHSTLYRTEDDVKLARQRVKSGEAVLNSPKAMAQVEQIAEAGIQAGRHLVAGEAEAPGLALGDAEQMRRARLVVTAIEHMGAQHGRSPELTTRIEKARTLERQLQARLNFGHHLNEDDLARLEQALADAEKSVPAEAFDPATLKAIARYNRRAAKQAARGPAREQPSPNEYDPSAGAINRRQWFHGTAAEGLTKDTLDSAITKPDNLFGQGIYMTSEREIAGGYARNRAGGSDIYGHKPTRKQRIYGAQVKVEHPLDLEQPYDQGSAQTFHSILNKTAKGFGEMAGGRRDPDPFITDEMGKAIAEGRVKTAADLYDVFREAVAEMASDYGWNLGDVTEHFAELAGDLRKAGFDALTHIGGKRTGHAPHQVVIALDPADMTLHGGPNPVRHFGESAPRARTPQAERTPVAPQPRPSPAAIQGAQDAARARVHAEARGRHEDILARVRGMRLEMQARNTERLRDAQGRPLEPGQIEDFLRSQGRDPETVAYLPARTERRFFHRSLRAEQGRKTLVEQKGPRTGELHRAGATEASAEILKAAGVRQAVAINHAKQIDRIVATHGMRHPAWAKHLAGKDLTKAEKAVVARGGYFTGQEAEQVIERARARGEHLVAMRAYPAKLSAEDARMVREDLQNPAAMELLGERLMNSRFLTEKELQSAGSRNVVIANGHLMDTLRKHAATGGKFEGLVKFGNIVNRAFRYAVLPQARWLAGNFIEPMLVRMPGVGSGVNVFGLAADHRAIHMVVKEGEKHPDPAVREAVQEVLAHQTGGMLIGSRGATIRREFREAFPAMSVRAEKAYGKIVAKTPAVAHMLELSGVGVAKLGRALLWPLDQVFTVSRAGESGIQRAALGHSIRRDIQEHSGQWLKTMWLGREAAKEAAEGLVNTPTQFRYMREQYELLGQYQDYSPAMRAWIQTAVPFLPWMISAARFVYWTMPAHRSAQTAFLLKVNDVVADEWKREHANTPPGSLRYAISNGKGGWIDLARYTTYGASIPVTEGDLKGVLGQFMPQFGGIQAAAQGKDPFGRDIKLQSGQKPGLEDIAKIMLNQGAEAVTPYLSTIRRLREHGETAYADSNVISPKTKPGTSHGMSAARRTFDPFRPTYLTGASSEFEGDLPGLPSTPPTRKQLLQQRRAALAAKRRVAAQRNRGPQIRRQAALRARRRAAARP